MPDTDTAKQKVKDFIDRMLSIFTNPEASCHILKRNDTEAMTVLVRRFGEQSIMPTLKASLSQSGVAVAFLAKFYTEFKSQPREQQSKRQIRSVFQNVLAIFTPSFQFPDMRSQRADDESVNAHQFAERNTSKRRRTNNRVSDNIYEPGFLPDSVKPEKLADLIGQCKTLGLINEVETLLRAIRNKCATENVDQSVYELFLMPMLTSLLLKLPHQHIHDNTKRYQKLYQTVCVAYTQRRVGMKPIRPANWTRKPKGCHLSDECHECAILDKFLVNPKENVIRFATDLERRRHIEAHS